jgi:hypothetical protein
MKKIQYRRKNFILNKNLLKQDNKDKVLISAWINTIISRQWENPCHTNVSLVSSFNPFIFSKELHFTTPSLRKLPPFEKRKYDCLTKINLK